MCDVYENDLDAVHVGESADIRLNAYPNNVFKGRIDNICRFWIPAFARRRSGIEVENPGMTMRVGMFVTATFYGKQTETHAAVPATAILHLHDRDWVYVPTGGQEVPARGSRQRKTCFRRTCRKCSRAFSPVRKSLQNALVFAEHGGAVDDSQICRFRA